MGRAKRRAPTPRNAVDLQLDAPTAIHFEGLLEGTGPWGSWWALASLTPAHSFRADAGETVPFVVDTILGPGTYTIMVSAASIGWSGEDFDARFEFSLTTAVPEPSTAMLIGVALCATLSMRRRSGA